MTNSKLDFLKRRKTEDRGSDGIPNFWKKEEIINKQVEDIPNPNPIPTSTSNPIRNTSWNSWWLWIKLYYGLWTIITIILLIIPLYNIFIGYWDNIWIIPQIYNWISYDGSSQNK